jgi:hypothetical protein
MTKTRKRASANSPVVVTDHGDGIKEYEVDKETAEQLSTIFPTEVVEEKAPKIGSGSNLRVPPRSGESASVLAARRKRNTTRVKLPADGITETAPTASEMDQRHEQLPPLRYPKMLGRFAPGVPRLNEGTGQEHHSVMGRFEDSRVSGAVKPSDAARIHAARKKRMYTSIMGRFAKSALTEDQKAALLDAMTDENARTISMSIKVLGALLDLDNEDRDESDAQRDELKLAALQVATLAAKAPPMIERLINERDKAVGIAQELIKAGTKLVASQEEKQAVLSDTMVEADGAFVFQFTISGRKFFSVVREAGPEPVEPVEVKRFELTDKRFGEQHETIKRGPVAERKMATSFEGSFEDVERLLQRAAERQGR